MKKSRWTLTIAAGAVAAGLGIAAFAYFTSTAVEAQSTGLPGTVEWMPADAGVVGHVDLRSLMESPLRQKWEDAVSNHGTPKGLDEFREATGLDPFQDLYGVSFAVVPGGGAEKKGKPEHWGAAVHGAFDSERILSKIREEVNVETEVHEGTTIYLLTRKEESDDDEAEQPEPALAFPDGGILLIGEPGYVREMIDAGAGRSASAAANLIERWGEGNFALDTFWIAASPEGGLGPIMPQAGEVPPVQSVSLSGRTDTELSLRARGKAADAESATQLADVVRGLVALGAMQRAENPDLGTVLDSIQIEQAENEVQISLSVPYETLESMALTRTSAADEENR